MKKKIKLLVILLVILAASTLIIITGVIVFSSQWKVDDRVFANYSEDAFWYPGTIIDIKDSRYQVQYDKGDSEWLDADSLLPDDIDVGTEVWVNYKMEGKYYVGAIGVREGDKLFIKYYDGDEERTTISAIRLYIF